MYIKIFFISLFTGVMVYSSEQNLSAELVKLCKKVRPYSSNLSINMRQEEEFKQIKKLLYDDDVNPNYCHEGCYALTEAARHQRPDIVAYLLHTSKNKISNKLDVNVSDRYHRTALFYIKRELALREKAIADGYHPVIQEWEYQGLQKQLEELGAQESTCCSFLTDCFYTCIWRYCCCFDNCCCCCPNMPPLLENRGDKFSDDD